MSDSDWISRFLSSEAGKLFCRVDNTFLSDKFNWYELESTVPNYSTARAVMFGDEDDVDHDYQQEAQMLYGLLHARFIKEPRGIFQMATKYDYKEFGVCPRHFCHEHALLPCGLNDQLHQEKMRLYCARCEDVYVPSNPVYKRIDGAFFGTAFPHLLFLNVPKLLRHTNEAREKYEAQIYGFRLHPKWHQVSSQTLDDHSHMSAIYGTGTPPRPNDGNTFKTQQSEIERLQNEILALKLKQTDCHDVNARNEHKHEEQKNSSDDDDDDGKEDGDVDKLDLEEYKQWNIAQIVQWMSTLENGRFSAYLETMRNGLKVHNIHRGETLHFLHVNDLKRAPFSVENVKDANDLMRHFQSLWHDNDTL